MALIRGTTRVTSCGGIGMNYQTHTPMCTQHYSPAYVGVIVSAAGRLLGAGPSRVTLSSALSSSHLQLLSQCYKVVVLVKYPG
jgi:hypothetical protein